MLPCGCLIFHARFFSGTAKGKKVKMKEVVTASRQVMAPVRLSGRGSYERRLCGRRKSLSSFPRDFFYASRHFLWWLETKKNSRWDSGKRFLLPPFELVQGLRYRGGLWWNEVCGSGALKAYNDLCKASRAFIRRSIQGQNEVLQGSTLCLH